MSNINWNYWFCRETVYIFEATLLTLNLNPKDKGIEIYKDPLSWMVEPKTLSIEFPVNYDWKESSFKEFKEQMEIIEDCKYAGQYQLSSYQLYLKKFVNWANEQPYFKISNDLKKLVEPVNQVTNQTYKMEENPIEGKFQYKMVRQRQEILKIISELGYDPKKLPNFRKDNVKTKVREIALQNKSLFTESPFNVAWQKLSDDGEIAQSSDT